MWPRYTAPDRRQAGQCILFVGLITDGLIRKGSVDGNRRRVYFGVMVNNNNKNMNSNTPKKFKRGTIGAAIQKLVAKCEANPMQFYILEQALLEACKASGAAMVKVSHGYGAPDMLVSETPGYKAEQAKLDAILAKYANVK